MPIHFITGQPRQGKTLFCFIQIQERANKENRPVFYCNIPEVTLPGWTQFDHPDKWMELPNDAIIVVDELQDFWGSASSGAKVPEPILELSKHGKRGIDFYFITQDPTLVHNTPRKLCETHWYVVRAFGSENAIAYKFRGMQTDPSKVVNKAEKYPWRYPKEAFGKKDKAGNWITRPWYKSADVHNIKRQIPLKVWAIPFAILLAIGAAWFAISSVLSYGSKVAASAGASVPGAKGAADKGARPPGASTAAAATAARHTGPATVAEYLEQRTPRLPSFPHTSPAYDQVTQPVEAPYPAACVQMGDKCKCYTQQATLLRIAADVCLQIVKEGYFVDWRTAAHQDQSKRGAEGRQSDQQPKQAQHLQQAQQAQQVAHAGPAAAFPMPAPAERSAPPQSSYLQGLAARNAQVRSSLQ